MHDWLIYLILILKKLSIEKVCPINDELERIYYVKYRRDPFYLVIDDLKGRSILKKKKKYNRAEFFRT